MSTNLKNFKSTADYKKYRATDGWGYPAINVVTNETESQIHYNNELRMRWYDADVAKTPTFTGDVSIAKFKAWVDLASLPCEIKKDGTNFGYIKRSSGSTVADFTLRSDSTASHYNTGDKASYLQMTEIQNVNVGLFQNTQEGWKEVRFNFDSGCPRGFHKWFAHPYWNSTLTNSVTGNTGVWTKLVGRYDSTPVTTCSDTASGINIMYGDSQGAIDIPNSTYAKGNWSANYILASTKATNSNLLTETYWEYLVLVYIFSAYFKTFNHQSIYTGLNSGANTGNSGQWTNGQTDTLLTHYGQLGTDMGYRFLHVENAIHGKQLLWGSGFMGDGTAGKYYMSFDDVKSNINAQMDTSTNADIIGTYNTALSSSWITNMDIYGIPVTVGSSSSTGFYDGAWSSNSSKYYISALGGSSSHSLYAGGFSRLITTTPDYAFNNIRGRATLIR